MTGNIYRENVTFFETIERCDEEWKNVWSWMEKCVIRNVKNVWSGMEIYVIRIWKMSDQEWKNIWSGLGNVWSGMGKCVIRNVKCVISNGKCVIRNLKMCDQESKIVTRNGKCIIRNVKMCNQECEMCDQEFEIMWSVMWNYIRNMKICDQECENNMLSGDVKLCYHKYEKAWSGLCKCDQTDINKQDKLMEKSYRYKRYIWNICCLNFKI